MIPSFVVRYRVILCLLIPFCCVGAGLSWLHGAAAIYRCQIPTRLTEEHDRPVVMAQTAWLSTPDGVKAVLINIRYALKMTVVHAQDGDSGALASNEAATQQGVTEMVAQLRTMIPQALEDAQIASDDPDRALVDMLEIQSLAHCLGIHRMDQDGYIAGLEATNWPMPELSQLLLNASLTTTTDDVWNAAREEVITRLKNGTLDKPAVQELMNECKALDAITRSGLRDVAYNITTNAETPAVWKDRLRDTVRFPIEDGLIEVRIEGTALSNGGVRHGVIALGIAETLRAGLLDQNGRGYGVDDEELRKNLMAIDQAIAELNGDAKATSMNTDEDWERVAATLPETADWVEKIRQSREGLAQTAREMASLEGQMKTLQAFIDAPENQTVTSVSSSRRTTDPEEVIMLKRTLIEKRKDLEKMLEKRTDKHPMVKAAQAEIAQMEKKILDLRAVNVPVTTETVASNQKITDWKHQLQTIKGSHEGIRMQRQVYEQTLLAATDAIKTSLAGFRAKNLKEQQDHLTEKKTALLKEQEARRTEPVRETMVLLAGADAPMELIFPVREHVLAASAGAGIVLALAVFLLLSLADQAVYTPEDVRRYGQLPLLGAIPTLPASSSSTTTGGLSQEVAGRHSR